MAISGRTEVFAVIGDPIEHTLSPAMHNAAFESLKLDYVFVAFRVTPDELEMAIRGVRAMGIRGVNVTMPHKTAVTEFLDEPDAAVKFLKSLFDQKQELSQRQSATRRQNTRTSKRYSPRIDMVH